MGTSIGSCTEGWWLGPPRPEGGREGSPGTLWGERAAGRGSSQCRGPDGTGAVCARRSEEAGGLERSEREVYGEVSQTARAWSRRTLCPPQGRGARWRFCVEVRRDPMRVLQIASGCQ